MTNYDEMPDYDLCALYCDYHEWLNGTGRKADAVTRAKYIGYLQSIVEAIARRYSEAKGV